MHWAEVRALVEAGTHNAIVATIDLFQRWIVRATAEGRLRATMSVEQKNAVLHLDAPLCCFMGRGVIDEVLAEAAKATPTPLCLLCLVPKDVCSCAALLPETSL